jgi:hypothetical protein
MNGLDIVFGSDTYSRLPANLGAGECFPDPFFNVPSRRPAAIEADRENLKDNVFRIKHGAEWLYDEGDSMITREL